MRKLSTLLIACICSCMAMAGSGVYVEYKIASTGGGQGLSGTMRSWAANDGTSRSEMNMTLPSMPGGGMKVVTLHKASEPDKIYMLNEGSKTYSVTDMSSFKRKETPAQHDTKIEIQVVGNEKVNGYNSTHIKISMNGKPAQDMWTTKDIAGYENYGRISSNKYLADNDMWQQMKAKGADGVPVRLKVSERGGEMQMDLVKAEKTVIPDDKLKIPADYKETQGLFGGAGAAGMPTRDEIMNMTPEQREKLMREIQKRYENNH